MWVKKGDPYPLIKAMNVKRLPTLLKLACSEWLCKWRGWVTHARIDEDPAIRGHDLCFDRTCQIAAASRNVGWQMKNSSRL